MTIQIPDSDNRFTRRRIFIGAAASLICAPAIVKVSSLMPIRALILPVERQYAGFVQRLMYQSLADNLITGRMNTIVNGKTVPDIHACRAIAHARAQGWLSPQTVKLLDQWHVSFSTI